MQTKSYIDAQLGRYPILKYQKLSDRAFDPVRGTPGSSGLDVFSPEDYTINPFGSVMIPLHLRFEIPYGWDLSVYNKSGVATRLRLDKGAELIDSDYRGNCHIHFFNQDGALKTISRGQKIAQLVMREVWMGLLQEVDEISTDTSRGQGGFGSTGTTYAPVKIEDRAPEEAVGFKPSEL